jgi:tetratricopeptide (TPR) repeat protein
MRFLLLLIIWGNITLTVFPQTKNNQFLYSHYLRGIFYIQKEDYLSALKELRKAKKLDSQSPYIRLKIASCLVRLGRVEEAERELKEIKKIDPDNIDASLALIFIYSYTKKDKELEKEYEDFLKKAHRVRPKDINISEYLAQFYFYKNRIKEAIEIYERIIENSPDYTEGLFWLGFLYEEYGKREKAIQLWKKVLKINPEHAPTLNSLGYIYAEEGVNLDEAESMIKKALEIEPQNGAYLDSLGWVYFKKGAYKKAEKYLKEAISLIKDPVIYEHLGDLYIKLGNLEEAVDYYKKGLKDFPEDKNLQKKLEKYERKDKILEK